MKKPMSYNIIGGFWKTERWSIIMKKVTQRFIRVLLIVTFIVSAMMYTPTVKASTYDIHYTFESGIPDRIVICTGHTSEFTVYVDGFYYNLKIGSEKIISAYCDEFGTFWFQSSEYGEGGFEFYWANYELEGFNMTPHYFNNGAFHIGIGSWVDGYSHSETGEVFQLPTFDDLKNFLENDTPVPGSKPKPITEPDATIKPKPTDKPTTGITLEDSVNNVSYKVLAQGKTVAFYKVNNKKATKVVIPDTVTIGGITYKVTAISDNACSGCKKIKSVTIGKHVTTIGNKAFFKCTSLKNISIPTSMKKIGKKAFYGCKKLKSITINPKKLKSKSVGTQAFKGIYKKAVIKVPKKQKKAYTKWLRKKGITKKMKIK